MKGRLRIVRGTDVHAVFKFRNEAGDPISLEGVTAITATFIKQDRSPLQLTMNKRPAIKAYADVEGIRLVAVQNGLAGNSIALSFDGVSTLKQIVDEWNTANPTNMVMYSPEFDARIISAQVVQFKHGVPEYRPLSVVHEAYGHVELTMTDFETNSLRGGSDQSIEFLLDFGAHPMGTRRSASLINKLDVV